MTSRSVLWVGEVLLRPKAALKGSQACPHPLTSRLLGGLCGTWRSLLWRVEGRGLFPGSCVLLHQTLHTLLASGQPSKINLLKASLPNDSNWLNDSFATGLRIQFLNFSFPMPLHSSFGSRILHECKIISAEPDSSTQGFMWKG